MNGYLIGLLFWLVLLAVGWAKSLWKPAGFLAIGIAVLYLFGPAGQPGVVDLKSYWHHQYIQPGLIMFLVSAGSLGIRLWWVKRRSLARNSPRIRRRFDGVTAAAVIGIPLIVLTSRGPRYETVRDRVRAAGRITDDDCKQLLLIAARDYLSYGPAEGKYFDLRFAPTLCRSPGGAAGRISESGGSTPHGEKLYVIYARQRDAYIELLGANTAKAWHEVNSSFALSPLQNDPADNQVIVKESWTPVPRNLNDRFGQGMRPAQRKGEYFWPGDRQSLFIMLNVGRDVAGTDNGWVYGTVSPDGKTVTSAGQVASCMRCHRDAPYGRLFGLPAEESRRPEPDTRPAATQFTTMP